MKEEEEDDNEGKSYALKWVATLLLIFIFSDVEWFLSLSLFLCILTDVDTRTPLKCNTIKATTTTQNKQTQKRQIRIYNFKQFWMTNAATISKRKHKQSKQLA